MFDEAYDKIRLGKLFTRNAEILSHINSIPSKSSITYKKQENVIYDYDSDKYSVEVSNENIHSISVNIEFFNFHDYVKLNRCSTAEFCFFLILKNPRTKMGELEDFYFLDLESTFPRVTFISQINDIEYFKDKLNKIFLEINRSQKYIKLTVNDKNITIQENDTDSFFANFNKPLETKQINIADYAVLYDLTLLKPDRPNLNIFTSNQKFYLTMILFLIFLMINSINFYYFYKK